MPRSTLYVTLLKKLVDASKQKDSEHFFSVVEEIKSHLGELTDEERFDLELNLKIEIQQFQDHAED